MAKSPSRKKYKCVYGTNQYGCCNKKPSVKKTKRCLEASKRRSSPCKYGVDENGCCNKRPTQKYRKSCRKSRKIRKSIESRIKLEKMLNDKHLIKKIIKSLTKSKRKSRKPQHVNRPSMRASSGLGDWSRRSYWKERRERKEREKRARDNILENLKGNTDYIRKRQEQIKKDNKKQLNLEVYEIKEDSDRDTDRKREKIWRDKNGETYEDRNNRVNREMKEDSDRDTERKNNRKKLKETNKVRRIDNNNEIKRQRTEIRAMMKYL